MNDGDKREDIPSNIGRRPKVARLIDEYGLEGLGAELERLWTANSEDRLSLRDLADRFNKEVLASAFANSGIQPLEGEKDNIYRLLTDTDVSEADWMRTRRRLEREGIDAESLPADFVTYQAIRTYLQEYRGAEYSRNEHDRLEVEKETIQQLRGRTAAVTEGKLEQLQKGDHLDLGNFRTLVDVFVVCEDCGSRYDVSELLDAGACDCADER